MNAPKAPPKVTVSVRTGSRAAPTPAPAPGAEIKTVQGSRYLLQSGPDIINTYLREGRVWEARTLFLKIAGQPSFYGNLADEELGRRITLPPRPQPNRCGCRLL